jgi:putative spermidine/putrescine transport system permease protein
MALILVCATLAIAVSSSWLIHRRYVRTMTT